MQEKNTGTKYKMKKA